MEPTQDGERTVTLRRVGEIQAVMVVYHVPAGSHPDAAALEVLSGVLGDTPSGRLYKALVDNKKAVGRQHGRGGVARPRLHGSRRSRLQQAESLDEASADPAEDHREAGQRSRPARKKWSA